MRAGRVDNRKSRSLEATQLAENDSGIVGAAGRFQILALDGGGLRGLFSAALLSAVEEDLGTTITDHFDLIAGTSTGGIIALGLGLGLRPREIVDFYLRHGAEIFRNPLGSRWLAQWMRPKFSQKVLADALHEVLGEKLLGDSTKRLVIPSYDLLSDDVYLFRTPHSEELRRDYKVPAWKVALATTAAPTYFAACREVDRLRLVDGGVWANNPTLVAVIEAVRTLHVPLKDVWALSIGTYDPVGTRPAYLDAGGRLAWAMHAPDLLMRAGSVTVNNHAKFLLDERRLLRIDPKVPQREVLLDGVGKAEELIARAMQHSRGVMPKIREMFLGHRAAGYIPCRVRIGGA